MPITVVLADGFDEHDVEITAHGVPYVIEQATTSFLTGTAAQVTVDAHGPVDVGVRVVKGVGAKADPQPDDVLPEHRQDDASGEESDGAKPLVTFDVPEGATLVLSFDERGIDGVVHTEPVAFD